MGKSLKGNLHAHGCTGCATRYEDACATPAVNGRCTRCRGGRAWQLLIDNRLPGPCCRDKARLVTKAQKETYRLGGTTLWFICPQCARTHPFDPRRTP